jgi:two-component system, OmpR family, sensor kinase
LALTLRKGLLMDRPPEDSGDLGSVLDLGAGNMAILEERLGALERELEMRDELLAIAAHELRNPMAAIALQVDAALSIAKRGADEAAPQVVARLEALRRQVNQFIKRSTTLLEVAQIRSGALVLNVERVDLVHVVKSVVETYRVELETKNIRLDLRAPRVLWGMWDRARLEHVVGHLVSNAIKYGEHRPIRITVRPAGMHALLAVRDHGAGVARDQLPRIFDLIDDSTSRDAGGFGVGLWLASRIVGAHAGTMTARRGFSGGTRFVVRLPRERRS